MSMYGRIAAAALAIMGSTTVVGAGLRPPEPLFQKLPLDEAMGLASKKKRIVFVDFCTAWCGACKRLDEDTWTDARVIAQLKEKTIPLKIDAEKELVIKEKYKINAYPTLLFLNGDGSILARVVGYQIPERFLETLQGVVARKGNRARKTQDGH